MLYSLVVGNLGEVNSQYKFVFFYKQYKFVLINVYCFLDPIHMHQISSMDSMFSIIYNGSDLLLGFCINFIIGTLYLLS